MKTPEFSLRPATIADAPLFYNAIDQTPASQKIPQF
jgi:hypothetical protein